MFRPIMAIIRFSSERLLVFVRFMRLCKDGEISSLHNRINLINSNILSDENLMMAIIGRNM